MKYQISCTFSKGEMMKKERFILVWDEKKKSGYIKDTESKDQLTCKQICIEMAAILNEDKKSVTH